MIHINENSSIPIYQQIVDGFVKLIVRQIIPSEAQMPSVREIAMQLQINPNTIQKAFKLLETEGYIFSMPGKGNFVASRDQVRSVYMKRLNAEMVEIVREYLCIEDEPERILEHVEKIVKELADD
jgi:GntR family transcriptional regulator